MSIENHGGMYYSGRKRIDGGAAAAMVNALREDAIDKPESKNRGISPEWLAANADDAAMKNSASFAEALPEQKALYRRSFTNPEIANSVVPSLFSYVKFDDYPSAEVRVTFEDGSVSGARQSASAVKYAAEEEDPYDQCARENLQRVSMKDAADAGVSEPRECEEDLLRRDRLCQPVGSFVLKMWGRASALHE